jgi:outer membrane receptor protein involved in Fe transport
MLSERKYPALAAAVSMALLGAAATTTVQAQEAEATRSASALEEIIVTARKREETLLEVPISITAFTEQALEQKGIESIYDIGRMTPNLSFAQTYGRVFDRPVIRGMSQILGERTVSFVVDGVYIAGNITGSDMDDIESVEVLKGPQAANFGRGSLAGVISYRTKKPTDTWEGKASMTYGDDGYKEISANVSGPIIGETLTFKLGGRYYDYDGQYTGISSDGRKPTFGAERTERVSGALRWQPAESFDVTLRAFASQNSDGLYNNIIFTGLNCYQTSPGARGGSYCGVVPEIDKEGDIKVDLSDIERQGHPGVVQDTVLTSLEANWDVGFGTFTALISDNRSDEDWIVDDYLISTPQSGSPSQEPSPTMTVANPGNITRLISVKEYESQELRLASNGEGKLKWLIGLYNYEQDNTGFNGGPRYNVRSAATGLPLATNTGPVGTIREYSQPTSPFSIENQAVFGSISYDPTDRWHLTLEGRFANDQLTTLNTVQTSATGARSNCEAKLEAEFDSFTPRGTVRYDLSDSMNVYGSIAQGNKPGDFNTSLCGNLIPGPNNPAVSPLAPADEFTRLSTIAPLAVDEESSLNYELGTKMVLMDGSMSLDVAIFFVDWTDQQVTGSEVYRDINNVARNASLTTNAGKTEVTGFELAWDWHINENWGVNLGYGYADAEFKELCDATLAVLLNTPNTTEGPCPNKGTIRFADASGYQTANAPTHTGNAGLEFNTPFGSEWAFFARADLSYVSERFAEVYNHASTGDATRLDGRFGIDSDQWRISVWARNLTEERSPDAVVRFFNPNSGAALTRAYQVHYPNGRQFGLTATVNF